MILVPVDGSAAAAGALACACDLGKLLDTEVVVCNAVERGPAADAAEGAAILDQARAIARSHEVGVACLLVSGDAAPAILELAAQTRADLIIMGTHGMTGSEKLVLGSVAEEVTRNANVPVLLLRDPTCEASAA